jgi:hypothetical protein
MLVKKSCKALLFAVLVPALSAVFATVAAAQEASPVVAMTRYAEYQGRYAVTFPITQAYKPQIHKRGNEMSVDADLDGAGYVVVCMDLQNIGPVEKFLDDLEAYAAQTNHARIVRNVPVTLGAISGREVELENDYGWQRISRVYLVGTRLYCINAQARDRKLSREMAKDFLDSFTLLDGKTAPPTVMPSSVPPADAAPAPAPAPPLEPASPTVPTPAPQPTTQPEAGRRYVNRAGRYFIDLPADPSESSARPDPHGPEMHSAELVMQGVGYFVTYFQMPARTLDWARTQRNAQVALFSLWKKDIVQNAHATVTYERTVEIAGRRGCEAEFTLPDGTHHVARMLVVGKRGYHIVVAGQQVTGNDPLVRQCLDSFGIID